MKLSIITINLNNVEGLRKTIESVISQTFIDFEYILIDGGSTDGSVDIIKEYADKITYWVSEPDKGIYNAMNKGIRQATRDYCLFLNSGDGLLHENVLKELSAILFDEDIVYGNVILHLNKNQRDKGIAKSELNLYDLTFGKINHQAAFIKRSLFDKFGFYSEEYRIASDFKFFLDTIIVGNVSTKYIDKDISFFDDNGISAVYHATKTLEENKQILLSTFPPRVLANIQELARYKHSIVVRLYDRLIKNKFLLKIYNIIAHGKSK